jgi:hypothetical protein
MSLFEKIQELNIEYDNHYSDLYIPATEQTIDLINEFGLMHITTKFRSNIDQKFWFDVPFQYTPYWEKKQSILEKFNS